MKDKLLWIALIAIVIIAGITTYATHNKVTGIMEQQQSKIEALQQENKSLHDDVWNLSNQLMKINK